MKILFIPFSVVGGYVAGFLSKKVFEKAWGLIDDAEPPEPEHRTAPWGKLLIAMALRGVVLQVVRGVVERASRQGFYSLTGSWPGEEAPDPE